MAGLKGTKISYSYFTTLSNNLNTHIANHCPAHNNGHTVVGNLTCSSNKGADNNHNGSHTTSCYSNYSSNYGHNGSQYGYCSSNYTDDSSRYSPHYSCGSNKAS
jgi:hypothetical protein